MKLTARQFKRFSSIVYHECGVNLHEGKYALLSARLGKRLRKIGIDSIDEYLKVLESDHQEMMDFLDAVSTNHTFFFRENQHFDVLKDNHQKIWCAASSSGEEPYSIAIYCLENGFRPDILATDISYNVLRIGEKGVYPIERAKNVPSHILRKYFQKGNGKWEGYIKVKDTLRSMVTFKRFNLLSDTFQSQMFDIVFCRNVFIYFDNDTKTDVANKIYNFVKNGGYFIIGGAESLNNIHHLFKYIKPSIYIKALSRK